MKEKTYTIEDLIEARNAERERTRIILEYLVNKNSRPTAQGGVDYETFFDDIQDFESSLLD
jgi:hypothetical protein